MQINETLVKEWHPTKNGYLTPHDVTHGSTRKVWWKCSENHEWLATIGNRSKGSGCPNCSKLTHRRKGKVTDSLQSVNPTLSKEWHPTKNENLTPSDFMPNSNKKVWWKCSKNPLHEWDAVISNRNKGIGCPLCHSSTSAVELRVYSELKGLFSEVYHRKKMFGMECDVFIPSLSLAIEIDGSYWHRNRLSNDHAKQSILNVNNINVLRLRGVGLEKISEHDIIHENREQDIEILKKLLSKLLEIVVVTDDEKKRIKEYIEKSELQNQSFFNELLDTLPSPLPGTSLYELDKDLSSEWHVTKNGYLTPSGVTPGSGKKVWWKCKRCGREFQAIVGVRTNGTGCRVCVQRERRVVNDNNLLSVNPTLSKEWNEPRNLPLRPQEITPNSHKKVWWKCVKKHEWQAVIKQRNKGANCPYCSGRIPSNEYCLQQNNPELSSQWHPIKNGSCTPYDVTPNSGKKVWWKCQKGHEWQAVIASRTRGSGCPYCAGRSVASDNCVQNRNPELSKEWHTTKNGLLTPSDFTFGSNKKVWWQCNKGHEWQAVIASRTRGKGCPICRYINARKAE